MNRFATFKEKTLGSRACCAATLLNLHPPPRVFSPFRPTDVCCPAGPEEPHSKSRRQLRRQGQGQGRRHQLHHSGLEGIYVQHLAPGADPQVSSDPC